MVGITASGIGSGMDINSLVSQLVAVERQPAKASLDRREGKLQTELSGVGTFKGALAQLQSPLQELTDASKFFTMNAKVGDGSLLTVSADSTAQAGNYRVEVVDLAEAQKLATPSANAFASTTTTFGSGKITFRFGSYDGTGAFTPDASKTSKEVTISASDNTLQGVRDAINKADVGVTANIVNDGSGYRLALSANDTGLKNALEITVSDDDGNNTNKSGLSLLAYSGTTKNLDQTRAAKDAKVVVDGLTITNGKNTLTEAIQGVTLTLQSAKPGTITDLTVTKSTGSVTAALAGFVSAYNNLVSTTNTLTAYDPTTGRRGSMLGDAGVRSVTNQLRRTLGETVQGNSLKSLSDIGISAQRDGTLKFDSSKLQDALKDDPQAVSTLLAGTDGGARGIANVLNDFLEKQLSSDGPFATRIDSLNKRISAIGDDRIALDARMQKLTTRYQKQFFAMDQLMGQLSATSTYLTQQLSSISSYSK